MNFIYEDDTKYPHENAWLCQWCCIDDYGNFISLLDNEIDGKWVNCYDGTLNQFRFSMADLYAYFFTGDSWATNCTYTQYEPIH
jgi:hypothetical protein